MVVSERRPTGETMIVRATIYPAMGITWVGNRESEFFLAPQVNEPLPEASGFLSRPDYALELQAVWFRVCGLNPAGAPVAELSAENARFVGTCIANKKSEWYQFQIALNIP